MRFNELEDFVNSEDLDGDPFPSRFATRGEQDPDVMVDGLFRHESGRLLSSLTRVFGAHRLEMAEDVVQDTLFQALKTWRFKGTPKNPTGWLSRVARNRAIDYLRRDRRQKQMDPRTEPLAYRVSPEELALDRLSDPHASTDDQLKMMLLCCQPSLTTESQSILILKLMCGFSVDEIGRGLRMKPSAVAQRLVRAKQTLRANGLQLDPDSAYGLAPRLKVLLQVLYLLFNEGYAASTGVDLLRANLCEDAIYLLEISIRHPDGNTPEAHALLALMHFQMSRFATRIDDSGNILLLGDQDRAKWDKERIAHGFYHLRKSRNSDYVTRYHIEAGIAACHASAPQIDETDWNAIADLYAKLLELTRSPIVALNHAVAVGMAKGLHEGLALAGQWSESPSLHGYYLYPATMGFFYARLGDKERARMHYQAAILCRSSEPEREFLRRRLDEVCRRMPEPEPPL